MHQVVAFSLLLDGGRRERRGVDTAFIPDDHCLRGNRCVARGMLCADLLVVRRNAGRLRLLFRRLHFLRRSTGLVLHVEDDFAAGPNHLPGEEEHVPLPQER